MNKPIKDIYLSILNGIREHTLKPGEKLPKEVELAKKFNTNRMNAHRALKCLEEEGLVHSKKRVGTFISNEIDERHVFNLVKNFSKKVMVMCSPNPYKVHWDNSSFTALEKRLHPEGYDITYCNIPASRERSDLKAILDEIEKGGYGALVVFPDTGDDSFLKENHDLLDILTVPLYMLNRAGDTSPYANASEVSMDPLGEGIQVGRTLKESGCKNVLFFDIESSSHFWSNMRYSGVTFGLKGDYKNSEILRLSHVEDISNVTNFINTKIKGTDQKWTIVAVNHILASNFIDIAKSQGLTVPNDFQLITFDDSPSYLAYNLTTMAQPVREVGELFANMILDKGWISKYRGKVSIKISSNLVIRKTFVPGGENYNFHFKINEESLLLTK